MIRFVIVLGMVLMGGYANAHQFTPTYPKLEQSQRDDVLYTKMVLFNSREDIEYYQLSVWTEDWKPVPFATESRIVKVEYLKRKVISIFIRKQDKDIARYICSRSKIITDGEQVSSISSRICSKIK